MSKSWESSVLRNSKSVIEIVSDDQMCCARAIVVAIAHATKDENPSSVWDSKEEKNGELLYTYEHLCYIQQLTDRKKNQESDDSMGEF
ncbi:uncharacterized protein LOC144364538 [Saccoglossus kowalevskii]